METTYKVNRNIEEVKAERLQIVLRSDNTKFRKWPFLFSFPSYLMFLGIFIHYCYYFSWSNSNETAREVDVEDFFFTNDEFGFGHVDFGVKFCYANRNDPEAIGEPG